MKAVKKLLMAAVLALSLAVASPAMAADSSIDGYNGPGGKTPEKLDSLPFTGLDLGLMAAGGSLLALLGFGLRRATRSAQDGA